MSEVILLALISGVGTGLIVQVGNIAVARIQAGRAPGVPANGSIRAMMQAEVEKHARDCPIGVLVGEIKEELGYIRQRLDDYIDMQVGKRRRS